MSSSIVLGGGCFWCLEPIFNRVRGVSGTVAGYMGGTIKDPTDDEIYAGDSGHVEVVRVDFDPVIVSLEVLLDVFFHTHDPTTMDRQGYDQGPQYRSIIYYADDEQKSTAERAIAKAQADYPNPIVTKVEPASVFYPAGKHHQNFYANNKNAPYCMVVIEPKLQKFMKQYAEIAK